MELEDWEIIKPLDVRCVEEYLKRPNSHRSIVVYQSSDGFLMILNPFGGGICSTQELVIDTDNWELTEDKIKDIIIFTKEE